MQKNNTIQEKLWLIGIESGVSDFDSIKQFLSTEGIEFGCFELNKLAHEYAKPNTISDSQRIQLLSSFPEISEKYSNKRGYRADVVCLYPDFEHIAMVMKMFGDVHYHFENEFWYFFDGRLGFTFYSPKGFKFNVIMEAGQYIQVPEKIWQQCFFVEPGDRMKSMRFFTTTGTVILPKINFEEKRESCS